MPSWPIRLSAGISMLSKKSALVEWFIIIRSGRTSSPLPLSGRMSMRKTLSPSVFFFTWSTGVVRARSSMRSDWSTREMNIFCPFTT